MIFEIKGIGKVAGNYKVMAFIEAAFWNVGNYYRMDGVESLEERYKEIARDIHKELEAKNYYVV